MHNLEYRLGKLEGASLKAQSSGAGLAELIEVLTRTDRLSGLGLTTVRLKENTMVFATVEVAHPSVRGTTGAAKSFVFSWWAGALSGLLEKEFDVKNAVYDQERNIMKCSIVQRDLQTK